MSSKTPSSSGKSFNNNRRRGNNQSKSNWKSNQTSTNNRDNFKGDCDDLKGKIYYIGSTKQVDNYNTTTEAILEYILRTSTNGLDVVESLEALQQKSVITEVPTNRGEQ